MDNLDKKLFHDLKLKGRVPNECEILIKECFNKKMRHHSLAKIIIGTCAGLFLTIGIVYAGTKVYERIWKEPEKVVGFNSENNTITKENIIISEEEAKRRANELLAKMGYEEIIESIKMKKNYATYEVVWDIVTNKNTKISINASNVESFSISNDSILSKNIENFRTTEQQAEDTARDFCKKYGYNLDEYTHVKISSNMNSEKKSYIWYISFYKEYDGIVNPYENISISFVPEINEFYYFSVSNRKYENNPVEITMEDAKKIALEEEKKINTKYEISDSKADLNIISMNGEAYLRITDYKQMQEQSSVDYPSESWVTYRTDSRVRKAWVVTIKYNIPDSINKFDGSYNANDEQFSYYIDATTGEIIGGCGNYDRMVKRLYM